MIPQPVMDIINEQIRNELESAYLYLSAAAWFEKQNLNGMSHWMRVQVHEETIHAMKFFDHLSDRGGTVKLLDLKQIKTDWASPLEVFKDALAHEEFISNCIYNIMKVSRENNDFASEPLLHWFVNEQIEEESNVQKIVEELKRIGKDENGLFLLDRELGTRVWPVGSCFNQVDYSTFA
jgi:ferritin